MYQKIRDELEEKGYIEKFNTIAKTGKKGPLCIKYLKSYPGLFSNFTNERSQ